VSPSVVICMAEHVNARRRRGRDLLRASNVSFAEKNFTLDEMLVADILDPEARSLTFGFTLIN